MSQPRTDDQQTHSRKLLWGGLGSLAIVQLVVLLLVYFLPVPFLSDEGSLFETISFAPRRLWLGLEGPFVAVAAATCAGVLCSALRFFPMTSRRSGVVLSLVPAVGLAAVVGAIAVLFRTDEQRQEGELAYAVYRRASSEFAVLRPGELGTFIAQYWNDPGGRRALHQILGSASIERLRVDGKLPAEDRAALERLAENGHGGDVDSDYSSRYAFLLVAVDRLRPGRAAEMIRACDDFGMGVVISSAGDGCLDALISPAAAKGLRENGRIREEDLAAIEAFARRPIVPEFLAPDNPAPPKALAFVASERARNR